MAGQAEPLAAGVFEVAEAAVAAVEGRAGARKQQPRLGLCLRTPRRSARTWVGLTLLSNRFCCNSDNRVGRVTPTDTLIVVSTVVVLLVTATVKTRTTIDWRLRGGAWSWSSRSSCDRCTSGNNRLLLLMAVVVSTAGKRESSGCHP